MATALGSRTPTWRDVPVTNCLPALHQAQIAEVQGSPRTAWPWTPTTRRAGAVLFWLHVLRITMHGCRLRFPSTAAEWWLRRHRRRRSGIGLRSRARWEVHHNLMTVLVVGHRWLGRATALPGLPDL